MNDNTKNFQALLEKEWEFRLKEDPIFATRTGDKRYNNLLGRQSEKSYDQRLQQLKSIQEELFKIQKTELPDGEQINYEIFDMVLTKSIKYIEYKSYRIPLSKTNGFHLQLPELQLFIPLNSVTDYENYIERLKAIPQLIDDYIEIMQNGLQSGQIPPRVTMEGVIDAFKKHTNDANQNRFFIPFKSLPERFSKVDKENLINKAKYTLTSNVVPSYMKFIKFLESEYIPKTREDISAINLPGGEEYYQFCIWYQTSLNLQPREIHEIGKIEVARIRKELDVIIKKLGFKGAFKDFILFLRTDPRFYVSRPEELLEKSALVCKRMDGQLPKLFKTLPRLPYGILPIPDYQAPGNYMA